MPILGPESYGLDKVSQLEIKYQHFIKGYRGHVLDVIKTVVMMKKGIVSIIYERINILIKNVNLVVYIFYFLLYNKIKDGVYEEILMEPCL